MAVFHTSLYSRFPTLLFSFLSALTITSEFDSSLITLNEVNYVIIVCLDVFIHPKIINDLGVFAMCRVIVPIHLCVNAATETE